MELQNKTVMIEGIGQNQRLLRMEKMKVQIDLILNDYCSWKERQKCQFHEERPTLALEQLFKKYLQLSK